MDSIEHQFAAPRTDAAVSTGSPAAFVPRWPTVDDFLAELERTTGLPARPTGDGWMAHCPAHDDSRPSLKVDWDDNGDRPLWNCKAGCQQEAVITAMGMGGRQRRHAAIETSALTKAADDRSRSSTSAPEELPGADQLDSWYRALGEYPSRVRGWTRETLRDLGVGVELRNQDYDPSHGMDADPLYNPLKIGVTDTAGELVNVETYWPVRRDGHRGPKLQALRGRPRDLWPAPERYDGGTVLLCEGAGDAIAATEMGFQTVAVPGTAFANRAADWATRLSRFASVIVAFDSDDTGRRAAQQSAVAVRRHVADTRVLALDGDNGYDLGDFLLDHDDGEQAGAALRSLIAATAPMPAPPAPDGGRAVTFASVQPESVDYLLPGVPIGMVTVLGGHAGIGKSILETGWAAQASRGSAFRQREETDVLLLNAEDPVAVTRDRLEASSADLDRVHAMELSRGGQEVGITLPDDITEVERLVVEHDVGLLIVDPINAFFPRGADCWKDTGVRQVLDPLGALARRRRIAVVVVTHLSKGAHAEPLHKLSGSIAYGAAARQVFVLDRDPDDPDGEQGTRRVLVHVKSNVGSLRSTELYELENMELQRGADSVRLRRAGVSPYGPSEIFALNAKRGVNASKLQDAIEWLGERLADGEEHDSAAIKVEARAELGVSDSTLKRAVQARGDIAVRDAGFPRRTLWRVAAPAAIDNDETADAATGNAHAA